MVTVASYILTLLVGIFVGVSTKYYGDRFTD